MAELVVGQIDITYSIKRFDVGLVNEGGIPKYKGRVYKMVNISRYLLDDPHNIG